MTEHKHIVRVDGHDHARIERWRRAQALARTLARRPDLIAGRGGLCAEDEDLLAEFDLLGPS